MTRKQFFAWCVHFYTACGLICAAAIAVFVVGGGAESFRACFVLMGVATLIDATDGFFARRVGVKTVLPGFDGRRLDDIVDFQTYTSLPLLLLWRAEVLTGAQAYWLIVPLLASAYGFSQVNVKTADGYFLGFPSYWNIVAFYLYELRLPAWASIAVIVFLSILTFVPTRYLYPSQRAPFSRLTIAAGAIWAMLLMSILLRVTIETKTLVLVSLVFPAYYMLVSWAMETPGGRRKAAGGKSCDSA
ncbi:MAG: phosphatidylcholine synthase [Pyrinomonadaceae bacterium]